MGPAKIVGAIKLFQQKINLPGKNSFLFSSILHWNIWSSIKLGKKSVFTKRPWKY